MAPAVEPEMIKGLRAKMIQPTICKNPARKPANNVSQLEPGE